MVKKIVVSLGILIALSGCQKTKDSLGLSRNSPDEFFVLEHKPLKRPKNYEALPSPERASGKSAAKSKARNILLKNTRTKKVSKDEQAFLKQLGTEKRDPNIREKLNKESGSTKSAFEKTLHNWIPYEDEDSERLNAQKEQKRLDCLKNK